MYRPLNGPYGRFPSKRYGAASNSADSGLSESSSSEKNRKDQETERRRRKREKEKEREKERANQKARERNGSSSANSNNRVKLNDRTQSDLINKQMWLNADDSTDLGMGDFVPFDPPVSSGLDRATRRRPDQPESPYPSVPQVFPHESPDQTQSPNPNQSAPHYSAQPQTRYAPSQRQYQYQPNYQVPRASNNNENNTISGILTKMIGSVADGFGVGGWGGENEGFSSNGANNIYIPPDQANDVYSESPSDETYNYYNHGNNALTGGESYSDENLLEMDGDGGSSDAPAPVNQLNPYTAADVGESVNGTNPLLFRTNRYSPGYKGNNVKQGSRPYQIQQDKPHGSNFMRSLYDLTGNPISRNVPTSKIDQILDILHEQRHIKSGSAKEEVILYSFLGVFVIFLADSLTSKR